MEAKRGRRGWVDLQGGLGSREMTVRKMQSEDSGSRRTRRVNGWQRVIVGGKLADLSCKRFPTPRTKVLDTILDVV